MTKLSAHQLAKEFPGDFPYRIALITRDTNYVKILPSYDIYIDKDGDSLIQIICKGLVSVTSKNDRKMKYERWRYDIHLSDSGSTLIEVFVLPGTKGKPIKVSSDIFPNWEVFKFLPSCDRLYGKLYLKKE